MISVKRGQINKTVTTAGTAEALSASTLNVISYSIQAKSANTDNIFVGDSSVSSTVHGTVLAAGQSESVDTSVMGSPASVEDARMDLNAVYIDSAVNGEGVSVTYLYI